MAYARHELLKAWHRTRATQKALEKAISEGKPAWRIAALTERFERQRAEHTALRNQTRKF